MGLRFCTKRPLSRRFLLPSTPLSARIAARVDLEGSRGLESLPGALFFSRYMSLFSETCHFLAEKNRRRQPREPQTRAGGRRQAGGGRRQASQNPAISRRQASQNPAMSQILASSSARMPRAGRRQASRGRRQAGKGRRQAGAAPEAGGAPGGQNPGFSKNAPGASGGLRGLPLSPPVPLEGPLGPQRAQKCPLGGMGPLGPHGPMWGPWGPMWAHAALRDNVYCVQ